MTERVMSGFVIATGLVSSGVGILTAMHRVRLAVRAYRKTETLYAAMPEGWTSWFLGGFSGLTAGTHWLRAIAALAGWMMVGALLIGLGVALFWRA